MLLSVIIPTCNRNDLLGKCLDRLAPAAQTLPASTYEVIVSDDSPNYEAEIYCSQHYPWVRYTRGPRKGPAANRNNGAKQATGHWLVFTDDDCLPNPDWLQAYAKAIEENPEVKAFEGAILPDDWELLKKDMAECPVNTQGGCFWSANIMVRKNLFDSVGGFNEGFRLAANEDQFLMNVLSVHTKTLFIQEAKIIHGVRVIPFSKKIKKSKSSAQSWIYMMMLNHNGLIDIMQKALINSFRYTSTAIRQGKIKSLIYHFYNLLFIFPQIPIIFFMEKRKMKSIL